MSAHRNAKTIVILISEPADPATLGQLRIVGPSGERSFAINLANRKNIQDTVVAQVLEEIEDALFELSEERHLDRLRSGPPSGEP